MGSINIDEASDISMTINADQLHNNLFNDSPSKKRSSSRLSGLPEAKKPFYGVSPKKLQKKPLADGVSGETMPATQKETPPPKLPEDKRFSPQPRGTTEGELQVDHQVKVDNVVKNKKPKGPKKTNNPTEVPERKRSSSRLREIPETKRPYYGPPSKHHPTTNNAENGVRNQKRCATIPDETFKVVCEDISGGLEGKMRIPATNSIDDTPFAPTGFTYVKSNVVAGNLELPPNAPGCKCPGTCMRSKICSCAKLNGGSFPYFRFKDGRRVLSVARDVVFECGPNCGCGPGCVNRISQRGMKYQLEVFRTSYKGWGVRTKELIPQGAVVCEYIGLLRRTTEVDTATFGENDYIFEIDCWQTIKQINGREKRKGDISATVSNLINEPQTNPEPEFCIDAGPIGNVSRFINHSCKPNLFVQCVLSSHHDIRLARIVLFASKKIRPLEELTYDYGYALDSVADSEGNIIQLACHCGAKGCRGRLH